MKQRNFWPMGIVLITMSVVAMIIWTIVVALRNPVELDNSYMSHYQHVDSNINEIQKAQKHFWSLYEIPAFNRKVAMELREGLEFRLLHKGDSTGITGAKITLRLTRPHTAHEDIEPGEAFEREAGHYVTPAIYFPKPGRWILQMMIETPEAKGYFQKELAVSVD
ncbi:MAG: FixH family protein [Wolinella sp.]